MWFKELHKSMENFCNSNRKKTDSPIKIGQKLEQKKNSPKNMLWIRNKHTKAAQYYQWLEFTHICQTNKIYRQLYKYQLCLFRVRKRKWLSILVKWASNELIQTIYIMVKFNLTYLYIWGKFDKFLLKLLG